MWQSHKCSTRKFVKIREIIVTKNYKQNFHFFLTLLNKFKVCFMNIKIFIILTSSTRNVKLTLSFWLLSILKLRSALVASDSGRQLLKQLPIVAAVQRGLHRCQPPWGFNKLNGSVLVILSTRFSFFFTLSLIR